jgi:flagellum-specific ATP synthase
MLLFDSVTRFARAQREIGLAVGEPAATRGYTPSVFDSMPKLLERCGTSEKGTITGFYTILVDGDDLDEPISDTVRGILDGHIVLSRKLAHRHHYPAIDISSSISRLMISIVAEEHSEIAADLRSMLSVYEQNEDLIAIGAYKEGTNPNLDNAIRKIGEINDFLAQGVDESFVYEDVIEQMAKIQRN